jgi:hypothetical protein
MPFFQAKAIAIQRRVESEECRVKGAERRPAARRMPRSLAGEDACRYADLCRSSSIVGLKITSET